MVRSPEHLRVVPTSESNEGETPCVGCRQVSASPRCDGCGAARTPGGYRTLRVLSERPHGRVYVARSPDGQEVALKELVFHLAPDAKTVDDFERENALLAQLSHPQIPTFLGGFHEGSGVHLRLYQVQKFVYAASLASLLADGALPDDRVRGLARQILGILDHLHGRSPPVLHRDVKPANLLLRPDDTLVLVDFGAARTLTHDVTHGATLVGTLGYMAPEQMGGSVSAQSDLYGVGTTLLHLLTGRAPADFLRGDLELRFEAAVPARWVPFLRKLLARDPKDRFASAKEALAALDQGLRAPSRIKPIWIGAGLGLVTTLVVASVLLRPPPRSPTAVSRPEPVGSRPAVPQELLHPRLPTNGRTREIFANLRKAQVASARLSALDQLLYSPLPEGTGLPDDGEALLLGLLKDPNPIVRERTARVLERVPLIQRASIDPLLELAAHDPAAAVRVAATGASGRILLGHPQDAETAHRADRLVALMLTDSSPDIRARAGSFVPQLHPLRPEALQQLMRGLREGPVTQRNQIAAALIAHMGSLSPTEADAGRLLRDGNDQERDFALAMLNYLPMKPDAIDLLTQAALTDTSETVRGDALLVLSQHPREVTPLVAKRLEALFEDRSPYVRKAAREHLPRLGARVPPAR